MRSESGFSLMEVVVAATVLVIGVAGTLGLIMGADNATTSASNTEGGTSLAREVIERVRQIPVSQVTPASVTTALQSMSGLAADPANPGSWTVKRRNTTYTLNVSVCAVDDPKDGSGDHSAATFCASGGGASGTSDSQPQDFTRVSADVSWRGKRGQTRHVNQVQLLSLRGADGPTVSALTTTAPSFPRPDAPIVSDTATTTVSFKATVPGGAQNVNVMLNGGPPDSTYGPSTATVAANGTDWTFALNVGAMPDQSYQVSVQAEDAQGVKGPVVFIPLLLNRTAPPAPEDVVGAMNTVYISHVLTPVAEIGWTAEDNVLGYHVYRPDNSQACEIWLADDPKWTTSCKDDTPQDGFYEVAGIYQDAAGNQFDTPRTKTSTPIIASPVRTWWFDNHHNYDTTPAPGCQVGGVIDYDMTENGPLVGAGHQKGDAGHKAHRFCAAPLAADFNMPATNPTRKVILSLSMKNGAGATQCNLTANVTVGTWSTGPQTKTVPAATGVRPFTFTWTLPSPVTLLTGAQPTVDLTYDSSSLCDPFEEDFNKDTTQSTLNLPTAIYPEPNKPTLPATGAIVNTPDGVQLTWNAPVGGMAVDHYAIYRDGYDYANREDITEDEVPGWTDPDPDTTTTHTYYVTAVGANMQESDPVPFPGATFP